MASNLYKLMCRYVCSDTQIRDQDFEFVYQVSTTSNELSCTTYCIASHKTPRLPARQR